MNTGNLTYGEVVGDLKLLLWNYNLRVNMINLGDTQRFTVTDSVHWTMGNDCSDQMTFLSPTKLFFRLQNGNGSYYDQMNAR